MSHSFMIVCGELIVYQGDIECPFFLRKKTGMEFSSIPESVHPYFHGYLHFVGSFFSIKKKKPDSFFCAQTAIPAACLAS